MPVSQRPVNCSTSACYKPFLPHAPLLLQDLGGGSVKMCPECFVPIYKEEDGACNHMHCANCSAEFCWLCMTRLNATTSLTHFMTLSGCTMYGKQRWSDAKRLRYRLASPILVPLGESETFEGAGRPSLATAAPLTS